MSDRKNFPDMEQDILKFWDEKNIFQKTLEKESPRGAFVFYEGPPTANGKPGIHHVLARAFKDVILRFKTMKGFNVPRRAGWDTHGLPVELQVEKELGISGKSEIEDYGIEAFNKKCKESVWTFKDEWERLTKRMGYWLDMSDPYITYSNDFIESVWNVIKQADDRGLVYLGHKVVPHCPRCGTALSSHEVAQGYKEVKEPSVYIKFKLKDEADTFILSWTTTPWTLPGNVALAIGEHITYVKVKSSLCKNPAQVKNEDCKDATEYYYIAKEIFETMSDDFAGAEVVEEVTGKDLLDKEYEPLYPGAIDPEGKKAFYVAAADFVTTSEGTGVVHTAVMYGEDDYALGEILDLPKVHTVDEAGRFLPSVEKFAGEFVKDQKVTDGIIRDLSERGLLFKKLSYKHDYPFCWRCDTPLLYYAKNSWFIRMSELRDEMVKSNQEINWYPEHQKEGRFGEWIATAKDWAISRERYWGTPLPIWTCDKEECNEHKVIGGFEELAAKSGITIDDNFDPHKPFVDDITFPCEKCDGTMRRESTVLDVWFDSGSMPFAQDHYPFENQDKIDKNGGYPAEFICEAIDQTRGWFYTMLAVATVLGRTAPYKNVISLGHINDKSGKKMSKSKGNIVNPWEMADKYGMDALRFHFFTMSQPGEPKRFDENDVAGVLRKNFIILWNVVNLYELFSEGKQYGLTSTDNILDKWILSKTHTLVKDVNELYDIYDITKANRLITEFINDLSTWYVRRSRDRYKNDDNLADKEAALGTTRYVLLTLSKIIAPGTPFNAEELYQTLGGEKESVHLDDFPEYNEAMIDNTVIESMDTAKALIEKALAVRALSGVKVRQALGTLYVNKISLEKEYYDIIADEVNVNQVEAVKNLPKESDSIKVSEESAIQVALDVTITQELKMEGYVRELTRHINNFRKELGLTPTDMVTMYLYSDDSEMKTLIETQSDAIVVATRTKELKQEKKELEHGKDVDVNEHTLWIGIEK